MTNLCQTARLIKTATKVFRYSDPAERYGWVHDVYFDRVAEVFLVKDFPRAGHDFEVGYLEVGKGKIEVDGTEYRIRSYEV